MRNVLLAHAWTLGSCNLCRTLHTKHTNNRDGSCRILMAYGPTEMQLTEKKLMQREHLPVVREYGSRIGFNVNFVLPGSVLWQQIDSIFIFLAPIVALMQQCEWDQFLINHRL